MSSAIITPHPNIIIVSGSSNIIVAGPGNYSTVNFI